MPVSSLSWRPLELRLVPAAPRRSYGLGQASTNNLMVEVVDQSGRALKNITVEFFTNGKAVGSAQTDSKGIVGFSAMGSGPFDLRATYEGLAIGKTVKSDEISKGYTTFLQFPVNIDGPLFRPMDIVVFGVAGGLIAAGSYWKLKPLEMTGEIALGAAVFGFIYRLQCMYFHA